MCMAATSCSYSRADWCGRGDGVRRVGVRRRKLPVQQSELDKHRARGEPGTTASWRRQAPHGQVVDGDGSSMGQGSWLCAILVAVVDQSAALLKKGVQVSPSQGAMTSRAGVALKSGLTATSACGHLRRQTKPDNDAEGQLCFGPWVCVCVCRRATQIARMTTTGILSMWRRTPSQTTKTQFRPIFSRQF
jgi:hypothetical protein